MPIPTAGVIKVELHQTYLSQTCINTFYYWTDTDAEPVSLISIANAFDTAIVTPLALLQGVGVVYDEIKASTVFGTLPDHSIATTAGTGGVSGNPMASFIGFQYRLNGTTKETRSGWKRFTGMVEINAVSNDVTGAFFTAMQALETPLVTNLSSAPAYRPIILRRPNGGTILNYFANPLATALSQLKQTTQNTRKA